MRVAFIGLGTMGRAMAANIQAAGHHLTVHNRDRAKEEPLAACGAGCAATPAQAAENAEVIVICVSDTPDVEEVVLGPNGVIEGAAPGSVVVDMSTISPAATRAMAERLAQKSIAMIDAPVSGGSEGAEAGTLAIMAGGEAQDMARVMPVLQAMGKTITHVGPVGSGQLTKAINQTILASVYLGVAEGMVMGLKAGLDMEKVVQAMAGGAAASWVLDYRSSFMIDNHYPLGFRLKLHHKDLGIALDAAEEMGVSLPAAGLVRQLENGLVAKGYGEEDVSALARAIRQMAGLD